jgi:integration host factor subunit alpha
MKREDSKDFLEVFFEEIRCVLEGNEDLKLTNFGNFVLRNKSARPGRNPRTGESAIIAPRRVVTFKPGPKLRENVESYRPAETVDK